MCAPKSLSNTPCPPCPTISNCVVVLQGAYSTAGQMSTQDPFLPSYYTHTTSFPPYMQGLSTAGDGSWSNGGDAGMFSTMSYEYNGFLGGFGYPPFAPWETYPASNDYWNTSQAPRKDGRFMTEEYYRPQEMGNEVYGMMNGSEPPERDVGMSVGVSSAEQGLKGLTLSGGEKKLDPVVQDLGGDHGGSLVTSAPPSMAGMVSSPAGGSNAPQAKKTTSWAAIASQPARPQSQPMKLRTLPRPPSNPKQPHNMDIGTWDNRGGLPAKPTQHARQGWNNAPRRQNPLNSNNNSSGPGGSYGHAASLSQGGAPNAPTGSASSSGNPNLGSPSQASAPTQPINHPVLDKLRSANQYNPKDFNLNPKGARFFIIKSYSEDDIHRSIKYSIWCSTEHGNKRLDSAYKEREGRGAVYLLFSVNGSGHFCGMAQMMSGVDYTRSAGVWAQDKWKGQLEVKWIYVKDVPNSQLRHIRLENNENKPVTNSRDTQEVPPEKGKQVLKILHNYRHTTSIFDDFIHYEKRQEEDLNKKVSTMAVAGTVSLQKLVMIIDGMFFVLLF